MRQPVLTMLLSPIHTPEPTMLFSTRAPAPISVSSKMYAPFSTAPGPILHRCPITLPDMLAPSAMLVCAPMSVFGPTFAVLLIGWSASELNTGTAVIHIP